MATAERIFAQVKENNGAAERTRWLIQSFRALPVLPNTLFQMNAVLTSTPVNLARLMVVVGEDPGMTANLLREARAAERDSGCERVLDAIMGLGVRKLQALLVRTPLLTSAEADSELYRRWRMHSVLAAAVAERIAHECGKTLGAQAYIAGLLHDIGKLPLLLRDHAEHHETEMPDCDGPSKPGQVSHCEVGHALAKSWDFSDSLCGVIREHHTEQTIAEESLLGIVIAADRVCHGCGISLDAEMARTYGGQQLEQIIAGALPWLPDEQRAKVVQHIRRAYEMWRRSHPGLGVAEI